MNGAAKVNFAVTNLTQTVGASFEGIYPYFYYKSTSEITPSIMPTTDSTYTKRVLLNPTTGVFAWEDNDRIKLPNYTKAQRDALPNKMTGDVIWQTDAGNSGIRVFDGTNWLALQTTID